MNAKRERSCEVSLSLFYMYIMQKDRPFVDPQIPFLLASCPEAASIPSR